MNPLKWIIKSKGTISAKQATCGWDLFNNVNDFTEWAVTLRIRIVKALGITSTLLSDCSRGRPIIVGKLGEKYH